MSRVIGVKGIKQITDKMVEAGTEALKKFTKAAKENDKVGSELVFESRQTLKGQYGIGDDDEAGLILKAVTPGGKGLDLDIAVDAGFESSQIGTADVTLEVHLKITALDPGAEKEK